MVQIKPLYYKIAFIFAVLTLISYFTLIIIGDNGLQDLQSKKQEFKKISARNEKIQQENVELYRKIDRLKNDPEYMESVAREELKMIGKDEIVFKFENTQASDGDSTKPKTETDTPQPIEPPAVPETKPDDPLQSLPAQSEQAQTH